MEKAGYQSRWRIELAMALAETYTCHPNVVMAVLGGSPSRNLADDYSDLDMVFYWTEFDDAFLDSRPLASSGGSLQLLLDDRKNGSMMELYYFGTLIVEAGHTTLTAWEKVVDRVHEKFDPHPGLQKTLNGFLDSYVIYGDDIAEKWKSRIRPVPIQLSRNTAQRNLGFIWKGCLKNQGLKRSETVFFYDGVCQTLKRLLVLLSAVNSRYFSLVDPRWIEFELSRMQKKPRDMAERIALLFKMAPDDAVDELERLISETMALVRDTFPDLDYSLFEQCDALEVRATVKPPRYKRQPG
jgi:hypothetical protein